MQRLPAFILLILIPVCSFCADKDDSQIPSYSELMLKNALVPGLGMKMLGNEEEARLYYAALPLNVVGAGLIVAAVFLDDNGVEAVLERRNGVTTLFKYKKELPQTARLLMLGGTGLSLYGNLLSAYSSYAVHSDYVKRFGGPGGPGTGGSADFVQSGDRISFVRAITAPFMPRHLFNADVLPLIGLSTLTGFSIEEYGSMGRYFRRERVEFLGFSVTPAAGLGLEILLACGLVTANAVWEELAYRGLSLQVNGYLNSSLSFGFAHLSNMLVPGVSVENTLLQTLFATAFGLYAADRVKRGENGLERMIALHFWNNLLAVVLGYLADPQSDQIFTITARFLLPAPPYSSAFRSILPWRNSFSDSCRCSR